MVFASQSDGIIHILALRDSVQLWWPKKAIKLNLNVCFETLHTEVPL
jgi:hypothetical protein